MPSRPEFSSVPARAGSPSAPRVNAADVALAWFERMRDCYAALDEHERAALAEWETAQLNGRDVGTSDWPGWQRHIGRAPWTSRA